MLGNILWGGKLLYHHNCQNFEISSKTKIKICDSWEIQKSFTNPLLGQHFWGAQKIVPPKRDRISKLEQKSKLMYAYCADKKTKFGYNF